MFHLDKLWLEGLARYKYSSLLRKSVNYARNKFYDPGPSGLYYKLITIVIDAASVTLQIVASLTSVIDDAS